MPVDRTEEILDGLTVHTADLAYYLIYILRVYFELPAIITEGRRSQARQELLFAQGRETTGNIVTQVQRSRHTLGEAFDIDMFGYPPATVPIAVWQDAGRVGEWLGLRWGGRFRDLVDYRHFEDTVKRA